jgi:hypothetical protein
MVMVVIAGLAPGNKRSLMILIIFWQLTIRQIEARELKAQTNGCQRLTGVAMLNDGKG